MPARPSARRSTALRFVSGAHCVPSQAGKTHFEGDSLIAASRYGRSGSGIGTVPSSPPFVTSAAVERRGQRGRRATEQELTEGRAQVLLDGQLDRLRPQPRPVALVPQVHQLAERAPAVVVARRQALALLPREPLAFESFEPCGRLR